MAFSVLPQFEAPRAPIIDAADINALMSGGLKTGFTLSQLINGNTQRQANAETAAAELANQLTAGKLSMLPLEMEKASQDIRLAPQLVDFKRLAALAPYQRPIIVPAGAAAVQNGEVILDQPNKPTAPTRTSTLGTIDGRLVVRDPYTRSTFFEDTGEIVTDFSKLIPVGGPSNVYIPDKEGNVMGFPTKGPDVGRGTQAVIVDKTAPVQPPAPAPVTAPASPDQVPPTVAPAQPAQPEEKKMVKSTTNSQKIEAELRSLADSDAMLNQMHSLYQSIVQEGNTGPYKGRTVQWILNPLTGGKYSPNAQTYVNLKNGFLASLRGMTGDDARFSDADANRLSQLLSGIELDPGAAEKQWGEVFELINKRKKIRWADEKAGHAEKPAATAPEKWIRGPDGRLQKAQ